MSAMRSGGAQPERGLAMARASGRPDRPGGRNQSGGVGRGEQQANVIRTTRIIEVVAKT